jgi:hypothetical protein
MNRAKVEQKRMTIKQLMNNKRLATDMNKH